MKVFFVIDSLANSGTEKSLLDIITNFSNKVNVTVIYLNEIDTLNEQYSSANINTHRLNNSTTFLSAFLVLIKYIKKEKPDIIVSSLFKSNILCRLCCLFTKTKIVGTFVSDSYSKFRINALSIKQKISFLFVKQIDSITAHIPKGYISNSASIKISNCKALNIKKNKVTVIYRGRNSNKIVEWKQPNIDSFTFIIIARVLQTKGYEELIDALSLICKKHKSVQLQIFGDGIYSNVLKQKIQSLNLINNVQFNGNVIDAWQYLYNANCFIFPSWYEGLSGSLIEATMTGIPIIASNISMNKEVISNCQNAIMHKVKDAKSIADCMDDMIINYSKYTSYTSNTRSYAINRFDIQKIANKYEQFLFSMI